MRRAARGPRCGNPTRTCLRGLRPIARRTPAYIGLRTEHAVLPFDPGTRTTVLSVSVRIHSPSSVRLLPSAEGGTRLRIHMESEPDAVLIKDPVAQTPYVRFPTAAGLPEIREGITAMTVSTPSRDALAAPCDVNWRSLLTPPRVLDTLHQTPARGKTVRSGGGTCRRPTRTRTTATTTAARRRGARGPGRPVRTGAWTTAAMHSGACWRSRAKRTT